MLLEVDIVIYWFVAAVFFALFMLALYKLR